MDNKTRIARLSKDMYQKIFGVHKDTFDKMLIAIERKQAELSKKGGPKPKLTALDMLIIFFAFIRDGRTMENIGFDYGCKRQQISKIVAKVTKTLHEDGSFALPSKRELLKEDSSVVIAIVDVTEHEIERPQNKKSRK